MPIDDEKLIIERVLEIIKNTPDDIHEIDKSSSSLIGTLIRSDNFNKLFAKYPELDEIMTRAGDIEVSEYSGLDAQGRGWSISDWQAIQNCAKNLEEKL